MTLERVLLAVIRSELLYPGKLVFRAENLYAQAMEHSTIKEALKLGGEDHWVVGCGLYAILARDGQGDRYLVAPLRPCPEGEKPHDQVPLYPPRQRAGGEMVGFIVGPLSFCSGPGGFHCLCQQDLLQELYARVQSLSGRPRRRSAGCLQRRTAATVRYAQKMGREIIVIDPITCVVPTVALHWR